MLFSFFFFFILLKISYSNDCVHFCSEGYYFDDGGCSCVTCPSGHYCVQNSTAPIPCPLGTSRSGTGGQNVGDCTDCSSGWYSSVLGSTSCIQCPKGYKCVNSFFDPILCNPGEYANSLGSTDCTVCPAGSYCSDPSLDPVSCELGSYSLEGSITCQICPEGSYTSSTGSQTCSICSAGDRCSGGVSDPCPVGTFSYNGSGYCEPCRSGSYANIAGSSSCTSCPSGSYCSDSTSTPVLCPAGTYSKGGSVSCSKCLEGTYATGTGSSICTVCPAGSSCLTSSDTPQQCTLGTYSPEGYSFCMDCPAGYECPVRTDPPSICPKGEYSRGGVVSSCSSCPAGFYADKEGMHNCIPCGSGNDCSDQTISPPLCLAGEYSPDSSTGCLSCAAGTYSLEGSSHCSSCPAGYYCPTTDALPEKCSSEGYYSASNSDSCSACLAGTISSSDHTTCIACPPGKDCNDPTLGALDCPEGTYSLSGDAACVNCPAGSRCPSTKNSPIPCTSGYSGEKALECSLCPEGYSCLDHSVPPVACGEMEYSPLGEDRCLTCDDGTQCDDSGSTLRCPIGSYVDATTGNCTECPAGYRCIFGLDPEPCSGGYFSFEGDSQCHPCPAGMYCPFTNEEPRECPDGTYSVGLQNLCNSCPEGFQCPSKETYLLIPCEAGQYSDVGESICHDCPAGFACESPFASDPMVACTSGTFSVGKQMKCIQCPAGFFCPNVTQFPQICEPGNYSTSGAVECSPCPDGHSCMDRINLVPCAYGFYSLEGEESCSVCPEGTFCDGMSFADCDLGYYCPEGTTVPIPCPGGYYGTKTGSISLEDGCEKCPEGYFCGRVSTTCCANDCPVGHYCPNGTEFETQFPCLEGTYNDQTNLKHADECTLCPEGYYCVLGESTPRNCPPGFYCPNGTRNYRDYPCPEGTWSNLYNLKNSSDCFECGEGKYCPLSSVREIECPIGTYNTETGKVEVGDCVACEPGFYCPVIGMNDSTLYPCLQGHYCPNGTANSYNYPCPAGSFTNLTSLSSKDECFACYEGFACLEGAGMVRENGVDEYQGMVPCQTGYYCPGQSVGGVETISSFSGETTQYPTQFPCPSGTFSNSISLTDASECTICPGGSYCVGGMSRPSGYCEQGYYCPPGSKNSSEGCPSGTYSLLTDASDASDCSPCPYGYYCPYATSNPIECPAGTYADVEGTSDVSNCKTCPGGYYCLNGTINPSVCGVGNYSDDGHDVRDCLSCEAGYYCPEANTSLSDMQSLYECPEGYYCPEGMDTVPATKHLCGRGTYCPSGTSSPVNCSMGTYNNITGLKTQSECQDCVPGYYCLEGTIDPTGLCLEGYYCPSSSYGPQQTPCPETTYRNLKGGRGSYDCFECPESYYCPIGTDEPIDCPEGYYCPSGSYEPTPCPLGTYGNGRNLKIVDECIDCPTGQFCDGLALTYPTGPCDPGYYCLGKANTSRPVDGVTGDLCPKGGYCELGSSSPVSCNPGTFNNETGGSTQDDCQDCTAGYYCRGSNLPYPTGPCDGGYYCGGGSATSTQYESPPGYYSEEGSSSPTICPPGTYNPDYKQSSCRPCEAGWYCPDSGMTYMYVCPQGSYCVNETIVPKGCPIGTYSLQIGLQNETDCLDCPPGKYCETSGLKEPSGNCLDGYYCSGGSEERNPLGKEYGDECPSGYYCPNGTASPIPCPAGTFSSSSGNYDLGDCQSCLSGKYCPESGMSNTIGMECSAGFYCTGGAKTPTQHMCEIGYYCPLGSSNQIECSSGLYAPTKGLSSCLNCPPGYYCPDILSNPSGQPILCGRGKYCEANSISEANCPAGTFSNMTGLDNITQCELCKGGMYCSSSGLFSPDGLCNAGIYCVRGVLDANGGIISVLPGGDSGDCPVGHYCEEGTTTPTPCPSGTFSNQIKNTEEKDCLNCTGGHYCSYQGQSDISGNCSEGYYCIERATLSTPIDGITGDRCPAGSYCVEGSTYPAKCPPTTYQPSDGESTCLDCPAGYFCEGNGTTPSDCPTSYYCPAKLKEVTSDLRCPPGTFSNYTNLENYTQCLTCTGGMYCSQYGLSSPDGLCRAGYYCREGAVDDVGTLGILGGSSGYCQPGFYCPEGSSVPHPCPIGTFNPDSFGTNISVCRECTNGKYCENIALSEPTGNCSEGYFCSGGAITSFPLDGITGDVCPVGYYCEEGSTTPSPCPERAYTGKVGSYECDDCPEGYFCLAATSIPEDCPAGNICPSGSGSNIESYPSSDRHKCPIGSFSNETKLTDISQCSLCLPGDICSQEGLQEPDGECSSGYYCPLGSVYGNSTLGILGGIFGGVCTEGHYCPTGTDYPIPCPIGTYLPDSGKESVSDCINCTEGFYCGDPGRVNVSGECDQGYYCPIGQIVPNPIDYLCPIGHYCLNGTITPNVCEDGTYQPFVGRNSCIPCPEGYYCQGGERMDCPELSYCPEGTDIPLFCPDGTYSFGTNLEEPFECIECPPGKYCTNGNITGDCAAGYICYFNNDVPDPVDDLPNGDRCPLGYYCLEGGEFPVACSNGTFGSSTGGKNESVCGPCKEGYYCVEGDTVAHACPVGYYCEAGTLPKECPISTYSDEEYLTQESECKLCEPGYICDEVAMTTYVSKECPPGYYCPSNSTVPTICPNGTYNSESIGKSLSDCLTCPGGYMCLEGYTYPLECPPSYYCPNGSTHPIVCPESHYCPLRTETPIVCPPSYYCPLNSTYPLICEDGYYCPGNTSSPIECPLGYKAKKVGSFDYLEDACQICEPGTYGTSDRLSCEPCEKGYYCSDQGVFTPTPSDSSEGGGKCSVGYYCIEGSSKQVACPAGTYQPLEGSWNCSICDDGDYNPLPGQGSCSTCGSSSSPNEEKTGCSCIGNYRSYQMLSGECLCESGYIYFDGLKQYSNDSTTDCQPIVFERCYSGQSRTVKGTCIDQSKECDAFCGEESGGEISSEIGICECHKLMNEDEICDLTCRASEELIYVDPVSSSFYLSGFRFDTSKVSGTTDCILDAGCVLRPMMMTDSGFLGVYDPTVEYSTMMINGSSSGSRRSGFNVDGIPQPLVCVNYGEGVIWDLSNGNYPVFIKDSLIETNNDFDYTPFRTLDTQMSSSNPPASFVYMFNEKGVYLFGDSDDLDRYIVVNVLNEDESCPDDAAFKPLTTSNTVFLGIRKKEDLLVLPNLYLVMVLISLAFVFVLVVLVVLYIFRTSPWKVSQKIKLVKKKMLNPEKLKSEGGGLLQAEEIFRSLPKEEMDRLQEIEKEKKENEFSIHNFGTEMFQKQFSEFTNGMMDDFQNHKRSFLSKYKSLMNETSYIKQLLGKMDDEKVAERNIFTNINEEHFNKMREPIESIIMDQQSLHEKEMKNLLDELESKINFLKEFGMNKGMTISQGREAFHKMSERKQKEVKKIEAKDEKYRNSLIGKYENLYERLKRKKEEMSVHLSSSSLPERIAREQKEFCKIFKDGEHGLLKKLNSILKNQQKANTLFKQYEPITELNGDINQQFYEMLDRHLSQFLEKHANFEIQKDVNDIKVYDEDLDGDDNEEKEPNKDENDDDPDDDDDDDDDDEDSDDEDELEIDEEHDDEETSMKKIEKKKEKKIIQEGKEFKKNLREEFLKDKKEIINEFEEELKENQKNIINCMNKLEKRSKDFLKKRYDRLLSERGSGISEKEKLKIFEEGKKELEKVEEMIENEKEDYLKNLERILRKKKARKMASLKQRYEKERNHQFEEEEKSKEELKDFGFEIHEIEKENKVLLRKLRDDLEEQKEDDDDELTKEEIEERKEKILGEKILKKQELINDFHERKKARRQELFENGKENLNHLMETMESINKASDNEKKRFIESNFHRIQQNLEQKVMKNSISKSEKKRILDFFGEESNNLMKLINNSIQDQEKTFQDKFERLKQSKLQQFETNRTLSEQKRIEEEFEELEHLKKEFSNKNENKKEKKEKLLRLNDKLNEELNSIERKKQKELDLKSERIHHELETELKALERDRESSLQELNHQNEAEKQRLITLKKRDIEEQLNSISDEFSKQQLMSKLNIEIQEYEENMKSLKLRQMESIHRKIEEKKKRIQEEMRKKQMNEELNALKAKEKEYLNISTTQKNEEGKRSKEVLLSEEEVKRNEEKFFTQKDFEEREKIKMKQEKELNEFLEETSEKNEKEFQNFKIKLSDELEKKKIKIQKQNEMKLNMLKSKMEAECLTVEKRKKERIKERFIKQERMLKEREREEILRQNEFLEVQLKEKQKRIEMKKQIKLQKKLQLQQKEKQKLDEKQRRRTEVLKIKDLMNQIEEKIENNQREEDEEEQNERILIPILKDLILEVIGKRQFNEIQQLSNKQKEGNSTEKEIEFLKKKCELLKKHIQEQNTFIVELTPLYNEKFMRFFSLETTKEEEEEENEDQKKKKKKKKKKNVSYQTEFSQEINNRLKEMRKKIDQEKRENQQKLDLQKSKMKESLDQELSQMKNQMNEELEKMKHELEEEKKKNLENFAREQKLMEQQRLQQRMKQKKEMEQFERQRLLATVEEEMFHFSKSLEEEREAQFNLLEQKIIERAMNKKKQLEEKKQKELNEKIVGKFKLIVNQQQQQAQEEEEEKQKEEKEKKEEQPKPEQQQPKEEDKENEFWLLRKLNPHVQIHKDEDQIHVILKRLTLIEKVLLKKIHPIHQNFMDFFDQRKEKEEKKQGLLVIDSKLTSIQFLIFKYGEFLIELIKKRFNLGSLTLKIMIASSLPLNTYQNNGFKHSFYYDKREKVLYIHKDRLSTCGKFSLILIHCLAHMITNENMQNDHNPIFIETFYSFLECCVEDLFFIRCLRKDIPEKYEKEFGLKMVNRVVNVRFDAKYPKNTIMYRLKKKEAMIEKEKKNHQQKDLRGSGEEQKQDV